ncbi:WYL domain-containing protein [Clostridium estertheticum]|uniref:WYL domain-containing protein n=1 Tax=Clostridium estertheticum TaxID=238834 RepID=UPI00192410E7|nr:WYL domain-containing protein [Clostridium estertheticum]MBZ9689090.1 WYL domain-containing protein [Clostridium estertheticum]
MSVHQQEEIPFLKQLLDAAIKQDVIIISHDKNGITSTRSIQPIGIYSNEGKWYCPSYCFLSKDYRVFRCDHIKSVDLDSNTSPIDLSNINLKNRFIIHNDTKETFELYVELTNKGVEKYLSARWPNIELTKREDGSGFLNGNISKHDISFFSDYFITYSKNAIIEKPYELIECLKEELNIILNQYN